MTFTATPVDGSTTPIPMSSAVPDGTNTPLAIEGGPSISTGGNTLVPVSIYEKDGNNVALGATTDAAVTGDNSGSVSAKLRGWSKMLFDVWDSVNHRLHVNIDNANANGQALMVNSAPVVLASDQTAVVVRGSNVEGAGLSAGALNADLVTATDISAYACGILHINANAYVGTLTFAYSNDNSLYLPLNVYPLSVDSSGGGTPSITSTSSVAYLIPKKGRYFRARMTAWTSGAAQGVIEWFTQIPGFAFATTAVNQNGTWTIQPGNTQNTTPWLHQGPTTTGTQAANTAANTVIKASAGALWTATITTLGTAGLIIYDNASTNSGTQLLSIPASAPVGTIYAFPAGQPAANGITSAGVTNCPGVTFSYR